MNYLDEQGLNTYDTLIKSYVRGVMSERSEIPSSLMAVINGIDSNVNTVDGKCDQILTAVSSDDVQGSKITINLVSEGLNVSYVLATSGNKVLGQLQNGDSVIIPFGAEYELTPHLSNGTDKFPKRGVATKMEETVTVYGSGYGRVDLGLPSGILWADRNVGARYVEDAGWFFQRGSLTKYYNYNSAPTWNSDNSTYNTYGSYWSNSIDPAYNYIGSSWVTPSSTHINELLNNCSVTLEVHNGIWCFAFRGLNENKLIFPYIPSSTYATSAYLSSTYDYYGSTYYMAGLSFKYPQSTSNTPNVAFNRISTTGTCFPVRGVLNPT